MRIALFPSAYAPAVGGVEELTSRLAHRLLAAGDEVEVWTSRHPTDLPELEVRDGVRVRRFLLPMPRASARALAAFPRETLRARAVLHEAAAAFRPDVIHVQCFSANGAYAARLARRLRLPLVITLQGETVMDDGDIYTHSIALRSALRWSLRRAAAVTACSRFVLEDAERRFGLEPGRGTVIPNGVELTGDGGSEPVPLPFERFVLGVGRIVDKKGFDLLLEAFRRIATRHPDVGLLVGGNGPARDDLVRSTAAGELGQRVAFPGTLSRQQIAWAMDAASVHVLPSRVEPFGIVVLEALRAGCPTVVSSRGGASEIVRDDVDGVVVDPCDVDALAAAIDRILTNPEVARRLGRSGRLRAASFDWETIAPRYRDLYRLVTT